jgi:16S rRNA (guanine1516-N2)-methyltransferase
MRIFRNLLAGDTDAERVLEKALSAGVKRVVVKRPRLSRQLGAGKPLRMEGKSTRYDVYFS